MKNKYVGQTTSEADPGPKNAKGFQSLTWLALLRLFIVGFQSEKAKIRYVEYMKRATQILSEMPPVPLLQLLDSKKESQMETSRPTTSVCILKLCFSGEGWGEEAF